MYQNTYKCINWNTFVSLPKNWTSHQKKHNKGLKQNNSILLQAKHLRSNYCPTPYSHNVRIHCTLKIKGYKTKCRWWGARVILNSGRSVATFGHWTEILNSFSGPSVNRRCELWRFQTCVCLRWLHHHTEFLCLIFYTGIATRKHITLQKVFSVFGVQKK